MQNILIGIIKEWQKNLDKNFIAGAVMTDLSKTGDCIQHNLLIPKMSAFEALSYSYLYLTNCKQYVQIDNTYNELVTTISGVP